MKLTDELIDYFYHLLTQSQIDQLEDLGFIKRYVDWKEEYYYWALAEEEYYRELAEREAEREQQKVDALEEAVVRRSEARAHKKGSGGNKPRPKRKVKMSVKELDAKLKVSLDELVSDYSVRTVMKGIARWDGKMLESLRGKVQHLNRMTEREFMDVLCMSLDTSLPTRVHLGQIYEMIFLKTDLSFLAGTEGEAVSAFRQLRKMDDAFGTPNKHLWILKEKSIGLYFQLLALQRRFLTALKNVYRKDLELFKKWSTCKNSGYSCCSGCMVSGCVNEVLKAACKKNSKWSYRIYWIKVQFILMYLDPALFRKVYGSKAVPPSLEEAQS